MKPDDSAYLKTLKLLENSYSAIGDLQREISDLVDDPESRDELVDAFDRYREAHHKLRRSIHRVYIPLVVISSSEG